ncbi:MAG: monovalent cation/H(+) antiporter subunit G, partial [Acidimicrobiia bacterium]|nr:monovalent cation/H(+) antiporter subunit G [Acidimicrobiia bacterium]
MIDVIAIVAVLTGAALSLLGAVGMLRFSDVFARMHASTKAATLGVILTTLAASLEVDTLGSVALLLLVTALLFLSAPLGASLLARAAYHDQLTPRNLPGRDDLADQTTTSESTSTADRQGTTGLLVGWLVVIWIALFASDSSGVVVGAILIALVVSAGLPGYRPRWPRGIFNPIDFLRFLFVFVKTLVAANIDVAGAILRRRHLRPAIIGLDLRVSTRTEVTLLMNVLTFTPGT